MGTTYNCACTDCSQFFQLSDGGGFSYVQWICDSCGKSIYLPRFAPRPDRNGRSFPGFLRRQGDVDYPPIPDQEIKRFTSEQELSQYLSTSRNWVQSGDVWDDFEQQKILHIKGACGCSGTWMNPNSNFKNEAKPPNSPHSLHRCPYCRSKKFAYQAVMLLD